VSAARALAEDFLVVVIERNSLPWDEPDRAQLKR
jgi:hypothetical protein